MLVSAFGVASIISSIIRSWPQAVRIVKRRETVGVSALSWSLAFACNISWVAYAAGAHTTPPLIANLLTGVGVLAILGSLERERRSGVVPVAAAVVATAVVCDVVAGLLFGAAGIGWVAASISIVMFLPQVVAVMTHEVDGVSPLTWWLIGASSSIWGTYGLLTDQWELVVGTFVVVPAAAVILVRVATKRVVLPSPPQSRDYPIAS